MAEVHRSALLPFPAAAVYDIVNDVARYPEFLPWCTAVEVMATSEYEVLAALSLQASGVRETFTTRNLLTPHERIELALVSGPFKALQGAWQFKTLGDDAGCRVDLQLGFQFTGGRALFGRTFAGVFTRSADRLVDAFCVRAHRLLG